MMIDVAALKASIQKHEGYEQIPYRDSLQLWTVGTGKLIDDMKMPTQFTTIGDFLDWLTDKQRHDNWLTDDINAAAADAKTWLGSVFDSLNSKRANVIAEMAYQLGIKRLEGFDHMKVALIAGDFVTAAAQGLDSTWAKQTPKRAAELMSILSVG